MEFLENIGNYDLTTQIQILGSQHIGKTNLFERTKFYNNYSKYKISQANIKTTLSYDFEALRVKMNNKIIKILLWDSAGYEHGMPSLKRNCDAYLISYDAFNRNSFNNGIILYEYVKGNNDKAICILFRIKYDLGMNKDNRMNDYISDEEALEFADKNNIKFAHVSSVEKYENGIKELFSLALNQILSNKEKKIKIYL